MFTAIVQTISKLDVKNVGNLAMVNICNETIKKCIIPLDVKGFIIMPHMVPKLMSLFSFNCDDRGGGGLVINKKKSTSIFT